MMGVAIKSAFIIGLKVEVVSIIAVPESEVLIIIFTVGELYMDMVSPFQDNGIYSRIVQHFYFDQVAVSGDCFACGKSFFGRCAAARCKTT